jgi:hypothetical protein
MHLGFRWESQKETDHWKDLDVDRRIILKSFLRILGWGGNLAYRRHIVACK